MSNSGRVTAKRSNRDCAALVLIESNCPTDPRWLAGAGGNDVDANRLVQTEAVID